MDLVAQAERAIIDGHIGPAAVAVAAAAVGVTTLVDMPLDSDPVTTTVDALHRKREAAQGNCDVGAGPSPEVAVLGIRAFGRPTEDGMAQLRSMWEASA